MSCRGGATTPTPLKTIKTVKKPLATLKKLSKEDHKEVKLLAYNRPHIAVEDYNGNVFLMGEEQGADLTGGSIATGTALGDLNGYTLTFVSQETSAAAFLDSPTAADPYAGMSSATVTVTEGTNA